MGMEDVNARREEIKDVDRKAAKDFARMFKAMGDKQVFGEGRFLADGTSPPPALTGKEERELKRMKDKEDYLAAKAKHEMEERRKEGKPLVEPAKEPDMPTPNKPAALGYRTRERIVTLTKAQAAELLDSLLVAYSDPGFQKLVH